MTFKLVPKKTGLAAMREAQEAAKREAGTLTTVAPPKPPAQQRREAAGFIEPEAAKDRIRIEFDDSGSMCGQRIIDARAGCVEFMRYCAKNQVAIAVHPMSMAAIPLDTNLPELAALVPLIEADGSNTPLFKVLNDMLSAEPKATRCIVFSDGQATDDSQKERVIAKAVELKIPVDTVFISDGYSDWAGQQLKEIADRTGGIYLVFDRNKVNFGQAFKFLAPGMRHMLASESFKQDLQEGKVKL